MPGPWEQGDQENAAALRRLAEQTKRDLATFEYRAKNGEFYTKHAKFHDRGDRDPLRAQTQGAGSLFPYNWLVDPEWATIVSYGLGTEGQQFTDKAGHTFYIASSIEHMLDTALGLTGPDANLQVLIRGTVTVSTEIALGTYDQALVSITFIGLTPKSIINISTASGSMFTNAQGSGSELTTAVFIDLQITGTRIFDNASTSDMGTLAFYRCQLAVTEISISTQDEVTSALYFYDCVAFIDYVHRANGSAARIAPSIYINGNGAPTYSTVFQVNQAIVGDTFVSHSGVILNEMEISGGAHITLANIGFDAANSSSVSNIFLRIADSTVVETTAHTAFKLTTGAKNRGVAITGNTMIARHASGKLIDFTGSSAGNTQQSLIIAANNFLGINTSGTATVSTGPAVTVTDWANAKVGPNAYGHWTTPYSLDASINYEIQPAAASEPFVTIGNSANLSAERALTAGNGVGFDDAGANATATLKLVPLTALYDQSGAFNWVNRGGELIVANSKHLKLYSDDSATPSTLKGEWDSLNGHMTMGAQATGASVNEVLAILDTIDVTAAAATGSGINATPIFVVTANTNQAVNSFNTSAQLTTSGGSFGLTGGSAIASGVRASMQVNANATLADYRNFFGLAVIAASGTITDRYGVRINDATGSGTLTNQYGIYIANMAKGSTLNRAIQSLGGLSTHLGAFRIGSNTAPTNTTNGDITGTRLIVPDAAILHSAITQLGGPVVIPTGGKILFSDADDSNYVGLRSPATAPAANLVIHLPSDTPAAGEFLKVTAFSTPDITTEWAAGGGGGGGDVATDTIWDAKGDLAGGTGADTAARLAVGADDTILMADAAAATGLKWVASASPSAVGTAAATGTADTFTRGDHVHAHEAAHIAHDTIWDAAGDLVVGTGADTAARLAITVPAANILEVLGVVNGETTATWKAVHDATAPAAVGTAAAGTALTASHRDHVHAAAHGAITTSGLKVNVSIGAAAFCSALTNGPSYALVESTTNKVMYPVLDFDDTTSESAQVMFILPGNYSAAVSMTAKFVWTSESGTGTVIWGIAAMALTDDDAIDTAFPSATTVSDTLLASNDVHISAATAGFDPGTSDGIDRPIWLKVSRDISDTKAGDARLIAVQLEFEITVLSAA